MIFPSYNHPKEQGICHSQTTKNVSVDQQQKPARPNQKIIPDYIQKKILESQTDLKALDLDKNIRKGRIQRIKDSHFGSRVDIRK